MTNLSTNKVDKNAEELQDKAKSSSAIASTPMVNGENATHEFLAEPIIEDASGKESNDASEGGMKCEPKRLYEEKSEFDDEIKWVTEIPAHIKARNVEMMDNATSEYALLLRTKFVNDKEKLHSILVQSPLIRAAIKDVLQDYPGVFTGKIPLIFEAPFKPFVHCWSEFEDACKRNADTETGRHLSLLRSTLASEIKDVFSTIRDFAEHGAIEFEQLWTIFPPNSLVVSMKEKTQCAFKVTKTETYLSRKEGKQYFIIHCYYIDWDGSRYGRAPEYLVIPEFEGSATPSDLPTYPLDCHPQKNRIMTDLIESGKKFQALAGTFYKAYDGIAVDNNDDRPVSYHVSFTKTVLSFLRRRKSNCFPLGQRPNCYRCS
jgi:hypothetical protein